MKDVKNDYGMRNFRILGDYFFVQLMDIHANV